MGRGRAEEAVSCRLVAEIGRTTSRRAVEVGIHQRITRASAKSSPTCPLCRETIRYNCSTEHRTDIRRGTLRSVQPRDHVGTEVPRYRFQSPARPRIEGNTSHIVRTSGHPCSTSAIWMEKLSPSRARSLEARPLAPWCAFWEAHMSSDLSSGVPIIVPAVSGG